MSEETARREGRQVGGRWFAYDKLRHNICCGGGQEDSIAIVAGGDELIWLTRDGAEDGKTVGSCGAKATPGFELVSLGDEGKKSSGECAKAIDVSGVDDLVKADIFDGCADDGAAGGGASGSRDDINVRRADDEVHGENRRKDD